MTQGKQCWAIRIVYEAPGGATAERCHYYDGALSHTLAIARQIAKEGFMAEGDTLIYIPLHRIYTVEVVEA